MIISKTPFRISFCGGGTDLEAFYGHEPGAVLSTAINKFMYISVNKKFDHRIRLSYSKTEIVDKVDEIQHPLVREAMKLTGVTEGVEITSMADIPGRGTGLGSSSAFTVGLLNALYAFKGKHAPAELLAQDACRIEIDILKEPIGKQDQYIAAYGGFKYIQFNSDESVYIDPVICARKTKEQLQKNLTLFYTGMTRSASKILSVQRRNTPDKMEILRKMRDCAQELRDALRDNSLDKFGELLHKNWLLKKKLAAGISNPDIDNYYDKALKAGALGGKILGAGGGGFLLLYVPEDKQEKLRKLLKLPYSPFHLEQQGTKIIYVEE